MGDDDIGDIELEQIIPEAIDGNQQSLDLLMTCRWLIKLLKQISSWAAWQFDVDGEDIREILSEKIRLKIQTVTNPNHTSWRACLATWLYTVANNQCLNILEHRDVVQRHCDFVMHENTRIIIGGRRMAEPCSTMMSQQEEIEQKELLPLMENLSAKLHQTICETFNSLSPNDARLTLLWAREMTFQEISDETGIPLSTVHRRVTEQFLMEVVKGMIRTITKEIGEARAAEIGIAQIIKKLLADRSGFQEMVANSLQEMARYSHTPRTSV